VHPIGRIETDFETKYKPGVALLSLSKRHEPNVRTQTSGSNSAKNLADSFYNEDVG